MAQPHDILKCPRCGYMVDVLYGTAAAIVCCDQKMDKLEEKTADASTEKHVPVIEKIVGGYKVTVGSTLHPMVDEHYIQWIELLADGIAYRAFLKPGMAPEATFMTDATNVTAREHCNKHGLWKAEA